MMVPGAMLAVLEPAIPSDTVTNFTVVPPWGMISLAFSATAPLESSDGSDDAIVTVSATGGGEYIMVGSDVCSASTSSLSMLLLLLIVTLFSDCKQLKRVGNLTGIVRF